MSEAMVSATNQDGLLEITDGAISYWLDLEPGDFSYQIGKNEPVVNLTRGRVAPLSGGAPDMRKSDESPCTGTFTARLRSLYSTEEATLIDLIEWMASDDVADSYVAANWASTHPTSDERTITLKYHYSGVYRGVPDQTLVFDYCALRSAGVSEGNPSTVSIAFTAGIVKPSQE